MKLFYACVIDCCIVYYVPASLWLGQQAKLSLEREFANRNTRVIFPKKKLTYENVV